MARQKWPEELRFVDDFPRTAIGEDPEDTCLRACPAGRTWAGSPSRPPARGRSDYRPDGASARESAEVDGSVVTRVGRVLKSNLAGWSRSVRIGRVRMQLEDMIMVSVDDHLVEPPSMSDYFLDHFPAKYRDRVPRVIHRPNGTDAWLIEGNEVSSFGLNAVAGRFPRSGATTRARSTKSARGPGTFTSGSAT